ncbi:MAG: ABC transporter permease [Proteobacteria bacterium]|nr:ABC transporter permease [Pseudomonadota bacterium]
MNPNAEHPCSLGAMWLSICRNRGLIWQLIHREVVGRYRGSVLGLTWSFFQPLLMLVVYTFVFSVVLKTTWRGRGGDETVSFAVILFSGLIVHGLFAECVNRAPTLILHNSNLVKRVVFPLEILPVVAMGVTIFNFIVSLLILFGAMLLSGVGFHGTVFYLPLVLLPLVLMTLGVTWFMAAVGVYLRDLGHVVVVATTILLFLSSVFFPISAVPEQFQIIIYFSPLTFIIDQVRTVLIWGGSPSWFWLMVYSCGSLCIAWLGFWLFQYTRKGFSDVL